MHNHRGLNDKNCCLHKQVLEHISKFEKQKRIDMKVYIIAHGSKTSGMGHIMRCMALAQALQMKGAELVFISKWQEGRTFLHKNGFSIADFRCGKVHSTSHGFSYGDDKELHEETEAVERLLQTSKADLTIVDTYNVSNDYFAMLKKYSRTVCYIDDLNAFDYNVDIVLNGTAGAYGLDYPQSSKLLLTGLEYLLIRNEFWNIPKRAVNKVVQDVLITTGGSDPSNMTGKILRCLYGKERCENVNFHVVIGAGFQETETLKNEWDKQENVTFYDSPKRISQIMVKCDLAIAAGGSTLYELGICQVPAIAFAYAENQLNQINWLAENRLIEYIGNVDSWDDKKLINSYKLMKNSFEKRQRMAERFRSLVKGDSTVFAATQLVAALDKS